MKFRHEFAPYDTSAIARSLTAHDTLFEVLQGQIHAVISESELLDLQASGITMWTRLSEVALSASELRLDFNNLYSRYDSLTGDVADYRSDVATYKAAVDGYSAHLEQVDADYANVSQAQSTLSATVTELSSEISGVRTSLEDDYSTTTETQTLIQQSASNIMTQVSGTFATTVDLADLRTTTSSLVNQTKSEILQQVSSTYVSEADINGLVVSSFYRYCLADSCDTNYDWTQLTGWQYTVPEVTPQKPYIWAQVINQKYDGSLATGGYPFCLSDPGNKYRVLEVKRQYKAVDRDDPSYVWYDWRDTVPMDGNKYLKIYSRIATRTDNPTTPWTYSAETYEEELTITSNKIKIMDNSISDVRASVSVVEQKVTTNAIISAVKTVDVMNNIITRGSVILALNNETSSYTVNADKINLNGVVTANENFKILEDGSMETIKGKIGGWTINESTLINTWSRYRTSPYFEYWETQLAIKAQPSDEGYFLQVRTRTRKNESDSWGNLKRPFWVNAVGKLHAEDLDLINQGDNYKMTLVDGLLTTSPLANDYKGVVIGGYYNAFYGYNSANALAGVIQRKVSTLTNGNLYGLAVSGVNDLRIGLTNSLSGAQNTFIHLNPLGVSNMNTTEMSFFGRSTHYGALNVRETISPAAREIATNINSGEDSGISGSKTVVAYNGLFIYSADGNTRVWIGIGTSTGVIYYQTKSGANWNITKRVTFT